MKRCIIAISRDFGSGGRFICEKLANALNIPCYDKALIQITAEKSGLSPKYIEQSEETAPSSFLYNIAVSSYSNPRYSGWSDTHTNDRTFFAQSAAIRELAEAGSCVIVGRCADYILRSDPDLVRVFVCGALEDRIQRGILYHGLDSKNAEDRIKKIDRNRANYYKYYTGKPWGDPHLYDIIINTSFTADDDAVEFIKSSLKIKGYL